MHFSPHQFKTACGTGCALAGSIAPEGEGECALREALYHGIRHLKCVMFVLVTTPTN